MCGRYTLSFNELQELEDFLNAVDKSKTPYSLDEYTEEGVFANFNVAPTQRMPVAYVNDDGERVIEAMSWGFIGWKPKAGQKSFAPINTRDDSLTKKPMWTKAFQQRRCLVPMMGFYEWKGSKGNKTPFYIRDKDGKLLATAGLFSTINVEGMEGIPTYSVITTRPNELMEDIHDRMPAFLHPSEFDDWLNPTHTDDYLLDLLRPYPDDALEAQIVSKEVGNVRNNHPGLIQKAGLF